MKYNCPKCRKEFALSSKLAGKQLRIRCTSCGTVFRMRIAASAEASSAPAPAPVAAPSAPSAAPEPEAPRHKYFAVIGGKRLGPMPSAALKRLVAEAKIDRKTLLWRKGLEEWLPAERLEELKELFPGGAAPPPLPQRKGPPPLRVAAEAGEAEAAAAAVAAETARALADAEAATPLPQDLGRRVTGDQLMQFPQAQPDEEPTDQEVDLNDVDTQFFAHGEAAHHESARGAEEIELGEGPMFPVQLEEHHVEKGAKASLKDFSVMVRLSRKSRRKSVIAIVSLASAAVLAIVAIFTFGDPLGWRDRAKEEVEWKQEGHKGLLAEIEQKKAAAAAEEKREKATRTREEKGEDPEKLLKQMQEKEWKVTLDEEQMEVDRERLASRLGPQKKRNGKSSSRKENGTSGKPHSGGGESGEEMTLEEFARSAALSKDEPGSAIKAAGGGTDSVKAVGDGMDSAMGGILGGPSRLQEKKVVANVKERQGDGSALKAIVARRVAKKVGGERKRIQSCMDRFGASYSGPGGKLQASLHFTEKGTVDRVSIKGGTPELEKCFTDIFGGWQISTINRKIKIPIAVRFE